MSNDARPEVGRKLDPLRIDDQHQPEVVGHVGDLHLGREDVTTQSFGQSGDELGLVVQQQRLVGRIDLHVGDHAPMSGDESRVARLTCLNVLERLRQDLMKEPGALGAGELELSSLGPIGVDVVH